SPHAFQYAAPLFDLDARQVAADLAPVYAGADRRRVRRGRVRARPALVPAGARTVAPAAFRGLWRGSLEDHLGRARSHHHRGAGERPVSLVRAAASRDHARTRAGGSASAPGGVAALCTGSEREQRVRGVFGVPVLLASATIVGLLAALV